MAGVFAEWEGVNSPTKGARLTPVTLKLARQCVESPQESRRAGRRVGGAISGWGQSSEWAAGQGQLWEVPLGAEGVAASSRRVAAPRAEGVGIRGRPESTWRGLAGGPSPAGRDPACFVPVGTGRPQHAEWSGAGQRFSSLRGVCSAPLPTATFPPWRGCRAGARDGALGKGAKLGTPPPRPFRGGRRRVGLA